MVPLLLAPVVVSVLALAAHFLRDAHVILVALVLALIPLLMIREKWVARLFQLVLVLAAAEWVRTLLALREVRIALDEPHARMTATLVGVAAFTALSALAFESRPLRRWYRRE